MTRLADIDGTPFKHDEWVRYSMARTTAAVLAVHAVLAVAVVIHYANQLPTLWGFVAVVAGTTTIFAVLVGRASDEWHRAKHIRVYAETRAEAAPVFVTILATTILKALQKAAEAGDTDP